MHAEELATAPPVIPWPAGLPRTERRGELTCLPPALAKAVHERLVTLDLYPALCQSSMDTHAGYLRTQCTEQRAVDAASATAVHDRDVGELERNQWSWPKVIGIAIGALAVGYVFGDALQ